MAKSPLNPAQFPEPDDTPTQLDRKLGAAQEALFKSKESKTYYRVAKARNSHVNSTHSVPSKTGYSRIVGTENCETCKGHEEKVTAAKEAYDNKRSSLGIPELAAKLKNARGDRGYRAG